MAVRPSAEAIMKAEITKKTEMPIHEAIFSESQKNAEKELEIQQARNEKHISHIRGQKDRD